MSKLLEIPLPEDPEAVEEEIRRLQREIDAAQLHKSQFEFIEDQNEASKDVNPEKVSKSSVASSKSAKSKSNKRKSSAGSSTSKRARTSKSIIGDPDALENEIFQTEVGQFASQEELQAEIDRLDAEVRNARRELSGSKGSTSNKSNHSRKSTSNTKKQSKVPVAEAICVCGDAVMSDDTAAMGCLQCDARAHAHCLKRLVPKGQDVSENVIPLEYDWICKRHNRTKLGKFQYKSGEEIIAEVISITDQERIQQEILALQAEMNRLRDRK